MQLELHGPSESPRPSPEHTASRHQIALVIAVVVPLGIALIAPSPMARPVIPAVLSMIVVTTLASLRFRWQAIVAALVAGTAVWFFNMPPGHGFEAATNEDALAIAAIYVLGLVNAILVGALAAREATRRIRSAEERAAVQTDRATLNAVQAAILPRVPLTVDGITVSTAYRMGGTSSGKLGGDFYVMVPFENGTLGIGVGDVAGHGPDAVGAMAEVRMTLRTVASIIPDPGLALERLELVLQMTSAIEFATVAYGILDPLRKTFTWVNAGHMPPILRHRDGSSTVLEGSNAGAICLQRTQADFEVNRIDLSLGDALVLYTDGLVESRTRMIDDGIERVREVLRASYADDDELAGRLLATAGDEPDDDVAIVIATVGVPAHREPKPRPRSGYYARRPSRVRARRAQQGEVLETPLGIWTANKGDWVVLNAGGTQLVPARTFEQLFDPDPAPLVDTTRRTFEPMESSVKSARSFVESCIRDLDVDGHVATLLTSELATNAVRHAGTQFDVVVSSDMDGVEIAVSDSGAHDVNPANPEIDSAHGRGILLVELLADEWGTTRNGTTKDVWFRLPRIKKPG